MADGDRQEMTPEEAAEMEELAAAHADSDGQLSRDPSTGAILQDGGGFDFMEADTDPTDDDDGSYGVDDFLDDAEKTVGVVERGVDVVADAADILDPPDDTPPAPRPPRGGTRSVSNETAADEPPAEEADDSPTLIGWDSFGFDTSGNLYLPFGVVVPWYGVLIGLGALYIAFEIFLWVWHWFFGSKRSTRKKLW